MYQNVYNTMQPLPQGMHALWLDVFESPHLSQLDATVNPDFGYSDVCMLDFSDALSVYGIADSTGEWGSHRVEQPPSDLHVTAKVLSHRSYWSSFWHQLCLGVLSMGKIMDVLSGHTDGFPADIPGLWSLYALHSARRRVDQAMHSTATELAAAQESLLQEYHRRGVDAHLFEQVFSCDYRGAVNLVFNRTSQQGEIAQVQMAYNGMMAALTRRIPMFGLAIATCAHANDDAYDVDRVEAFLNALGNDEGKNVPVVHEEISQFKTAVQLEHLLFGTGVVPEFTHVYTIFTHMAALLKQLADAE